MVNYLATYIPYTTLLITMHTLPFLPLKIWYLTSPKKMVVFLLVVKYTPSKLKSSKIVAKLFLHELAIVIMSIFLVSSQFTNQYGTWGCYELKNKHAFGTNHMLCQFIQLQTKHASKQWTKMWIHGFLCSTINCQCWTYTIPTQNWQNHGHVIMNARIHDVA
jgi:hypothetical protein